MNSMNPMGNEDGLQRVGIRWAMNQVDKSMNPMDGNEDDLQRCVVKGRNPMGNEDGLQRCTVKSRNLKVYCAVYWKEQGMD